MPESGSQSSVGPMTMMMIAMGVKLQMSREMLRFGCRETGDGRRESEVGVSECEALLSGNHSLAA